VNRRSMAFTAVLTTATLAGFLQLEQANARSEAAANHTAAGTYAHLRQRQHKDLAKEPARAELNQLIRDRDSSDIERHRRFRTLPPPSGEVVTHYRDLTVAVTDVAVSADTGEFTLAEQYPGGPNINDTRLKNIEAAG
jgi:hypothetical protein